MLLHSQSKVDERFNQGRISEIRVSISLWSKESQAQKESMFLAPKSGESLLRFNFIQVDKNT